MNMKIATAKNSLIIRILLLMICCVLFMPQGIQAQQKRETMADTVRVASMTLAITGITNPVSHIQSIARAETPTLRGSTSRSGASLAGKRPNISSSAKRDPLKWALDADASPAALPSTPLLPSFYPCAKVSYTFCLLLPESHGHITWFALAPPASLCA
jgi:hypothetical protein